MLGSLEGNLRMEQSAERPDETEHQEEPTAPEVPGQTRSEGPDPVIGAGLVLFGIFVMGLAGSRDWHYIFNAGTAVAITGAAVFVLFVALSAMRQRSSGQGT
jgi:hypothetical protein